MTKIPQSQRLELHGGSIGVLILYTFPGASRWAQSLHDAGNTVFLPSFTPGATSWEQLKRAQWNSWYDAIVEDFRDLKHLCEKVFIAGFDVGGALALRLAENFGDEIDGVILLEPSLPLDHRIFSKQWRAVEMDLYLVDQPLLIMYSEEIREENPDDSIMIADEVSSPFIREVILDRSFHMQSADHDAPLLQEESAAFINEIVSGVWLVDIADDSELIDAEFESIVAGLSLDESAPTTYLDELDRPDPDDHFQAPDPKLAPINDRSKRNAIFAMAAGPLYAIVAMLLSFDPLGVEPWPGLLSFFGGLAVFLFRLRDDFTDEDGAIV